MKLWHFVAVLVGGVVLVAGLGKMDRADPEGVREWLIEGPQKPQPQAIHFSATLEAPGDMAITQVTAFDTMTCTVQIMGLDPEVTGNYWHPLSNLVLEIGSVARCELSPMEGEVYGGAWCHKFAVGRELADPEAEYEIVYIPADGALHDIAVEIKLPMNLLCATEANPIGYPEKASATHAKEWTAEDTWSPMLDGTATVTAGPFTESWAVGTGNVLRRVVISGDVQMATGNGLDGESDYFRIVDLAWNAAKIDASHLNEELGSSVDGSLWLTGSGTTIRCWQDDFLGGSPLSAFSIGEWVEPPRVYAFTGLDVVDMDGNAISDVEVWCPAVQVYDATAEEWQPQKKTVADWQAASYTDTWGCYSWDTDPPPDGAVRLLADVTFYIDADSGQAHNLDGFA